jgi:hypothetical protein
VFQERRSEAEMPNECPVIEADLTPGSRRRLSRELRSSWTSSRDRTRPEADQWLIVAVGTNRARGRAVDGGTEGDRAAAEWVLDVLASIAGVPGRMHDRGFVVGRAERSCR